MTIFSRVKDISAALFSRIQGLKIYRKAAKNILKQGVAVRDAVSEDEEELSVLYTMTKADIKKGIVDIRREGSWLVAKRQGQIVGGLTVTRCEKNPSLWLIFGLQVKPILRGLGIGEMIAIEALERARSGGAKEVGLFVNKSAKASIGLYKKIGFEIADTPPEFNRSEGELYLLYKLKG